MAKWNINRPMRIAATLVVIALVAAGLWQLAQARNKLEIVSIKLQGVMGTDAELAVVVEQGQRELADQALLQAQQRLARIEALMSTHLEQSELSQLNNARAGQLVQLSDETMDVLRLSRQLAQNTAGAFDITCKPLLDLWRQAQKEDRLPTPQEIQQARLRVGWDKFRLAENGVTKTIDSASMELGGIAKKYAIDLAAEAMRQSGATGGLVNVGGDIRVFGRHRGSDIWEVDIKNPFGGDKPLASLRLKNAAVCTSGNYERFYRIGQKQFSHIVDPRTGTPADMVPSVTTVGPEAVSGAWATALSVLGEEGLTMLPDDLAAMLVLGSADDIKTVSSPNWGRYAGQQSSAVVPKKSTSYATPKSKSAAKPAAATEAANKP